MPGPREERRSLCYYPVDSAVEMDSGKGRGWGISGYKGGYWGGGGYLFRR